MISCRFIGTMALEELRCEGNMLFTKRRWSEAISKYGEYIALLCKNEPNHDTRSKLVIGYSNRAEAWLKLEKYVDALEDCENALKINKTHLKSFMRKARALEGLLLYEEVVLTYSMLREDFNLTAAEKTWVDEALRVAQKKDRQSRFGDIEQDLEEHWEERNVGPSFLESAPNLEEYVGPVEVGRTSTMGRGLFATRDIEAGELLLVSNALTSNRFDLECEVKLMETTMNKLLHSVEEIVSRARENVNDLSQLQRLIQLHTLGGPYPDDSLHRDAPPMRYFIPVNALPEGSWRVTEQDMEYLSLSNGFNRDFLRKVVHDRQIYQHGSKLIKISEIYVLPSLMNHSCLPNVSVVALYNDKASKVFRASRFIAEGEELFHAYHNIFCPLDERRMLVGEVPCGCVRCTLEFNLLQEVTLMHYMTSECTDLVVVNEAERLSQFCVEELARMQRRCITAMTAIHSLFREVPTLAKLSREKQDWIRAGFVRFARILLDPSMKKLPNLSEEHTRLRSRIIADMILSMQSVDPASDMALAMCSEAARDTPIIYNAMTDSIQSIDSEEEGGPGGTDVLLDCSRKIIEYTYGPEMCCRIIFKIFISSEGRLNDLPF